MKFTPPISDRETDKLLEIIQNPDGWEIEAINQARAELELRGIGIEQQINREKSFKKYKRKSLLIKQNASYSTLELVSIVLLGPILLMVIGGVSIFNPGDEYTKMKRQRRVALLLGFVLIAVFLFFGLN